MVHVPSSFIPEWKIIVRTVDFISSYWFKNIGAELQRRRCLGVADGDEVIAEAE